LAIRGETKDVFWAIVLFNALEPLPIDDV